MKEKTLGTKLLLAAVTLGVLAYFSIQAVRYFGDPLTTTIAYQYQVEMSTVLSGYVVRDEAILTDDTSGLLQLQRAEGERISDGGVVALVYADQATLDRQKEIQSLHTQIEQLQYAQEAALGAEVVSAKLDAQILQSDPRLPRRSGGGPAGHGGGVRSRAAEPGAQAGLHLCRYRRTCPPRSPSCRASCKQPAGPGGKLCPADHRAAGGALLRRGGRL